MGLGPLAILASFCAAATLAGCQSIEVVMNKPLEQVAAADSPTISTGGYRLPALAPPEHDDLLLILAFSGGGKRSSAFSYGALTAMRELQVTGGEAPHAMLSEIDIISSVSGGTFTSMYYGLHRDKLFTDYYSDFLSVDIDSYIYGIYLLPWNWDWLVNPTVGTNDYMAKVYDDHMFHGATYADLIKNGRPMIMADATDITYGKVFSFQQDTFDLICSNLADFPLARATAASNGFPVLFSPVTLISYAKDCKGRVPGWYGTAKEAMAKDPDSRLAVAAQQAEEYLDEKQTLYVHLLDGGIVDNLALRGLINSMLLLFESPRTVVERGLMPREPNTSTCSDTAAGRASSIPAIAVKVMREITFGLVNSR
jgi:NTE family protein